MLIIDPTDRILLFRTETAPMDPARAISGYWYVPGGGVEQGESFDEAARRELWEEVGIRGVTIGPCVWMREQVLYFLGRGEELAHERFFPVWVKDNDISFDNLVDIEAEVLSAHRWWSLDGLRQTTDIVFPEDLPSLLEAVLGGDSPEEPIRIR